VESHGGMVKSIEMGLPKMRIEEAAARKQARIDTGKDIIVGVNAHRYEGKEQKLDLLEVDNAAVRINQVERLARIRRERNGADVARALEAIAQCAETGQGNLLGLAV